MKGEKVVWKCMDCGFKEVNRKQWDGLRCPVCNGPLLIGTLYSEVKKSADAEISDENQ